MNKYRIYITASKKNGTLYIGVTNNLQRRISEHRSGLIPGFTSRYGVHHLLYFEEYADVGDAIQREKTLQHWNRKWKIALIEKMNLEWRDLSNDPN